MVRRNRQQLATHNHLLHLVADTHALDDLNILQAGKNLVLNLETCLHTESGALLDGERLGLEFLEGILRGEINNDVWSALNLPKDASALCRKTSRPQILPRDQERR